MNHTINHMLSFDIEHWFEGYLYRGIKSYKHIQHNDGILLENLLCLLNKYNRKATFFVTGKFALEYSDLIKEIAINRHEVASHSFSHKLINSTTTSDEFSYDLKKSIDVIENITNVSVKGYRAPKWSLNKENKAMVFNELQKNNILYDSSIFPGTDLYQSFYKKNTDKNFFVIENNIIEVPASSLQFFNIHIPIGGIYFRILPFFLTKKIFKINERIGMSNLFYLHLYDLDVNTPIINSNNIFYNFVRSYGNKNSLKNLEKLLKVFNFCSIHDFLRNNIHS